MNNKDIPGIHKIISKAGFDYWRVYEFNDDLSVFPALLDKNTPPSKLIRKYQNIRALAGKGTPETGYTDCLYAHFLLMEHEMTKIKKVQFVTRQDAATPYFFLDSGGNVSFYSWFSQRERRVIGNLLTEDFNQILQRLSDISEKDLAYDSRTEEDFVWATIGNMPVFARTFDGSYDHEELEQIKHRYLIKFQLLEKLHNKRRDSQERKRGKTIAKGL